MTRNKKIGLILIILPFFLIIGSLAGYTVAGFVIQQKITASQSDPVSAGSGVPVYSILRVVLGFAGLLGVLGLFICIPAGIYFLNKKNDEESAKELSELQTNEKYLNLTPDQINYIRKWSWGAFFGQLFWPLGNKLYFWSLAVFIPFFNIYAWFKLSISGRKMAWEKGGWKNFEQFKKRQKIMALIIGVFIILGVGSRIASYRVESEKNIGIFRQQLATSTARVSQPDSQVGMVTDSVSSTVVAQPYQIYSKIDRNGGGVDVQVLIQPFVGSNTELVEYLKTIINEVAIANGNDLLIYFFDTEDAINIFNQPPSTAVRAQVGSVGKHWVATYTGDIPYSDSDLFIRTYPLSYPSDYIPYNPAE